MEDLHREMGTALTKGSVTVKTCHSLFKVSHVLHHPILEIGLHLFVTCIHCHVQSSQNAGFVMS